MAGRISGKTKAKKTTGKSIKSVSKKTKKLSEKKPSVTRKAGAKNGRVDEAGVESFPASDPPAFTSFEGPGAPKRKR